MWVCFVWYVFKIGAAYFRLGIIFDTKFPPQSRGLSSPFSMGPRKCDVWSLGVTLYICSICTLDCTNAFFRTWQGLHDLHDLLIINHCQHICLVELYTHVHQFIPGTVYTSLWCFSQFVSSQIRNAVFFWSQKSYQSFWILGQEPWVFDRTRYMDEKEIMRALQVRR